MKKILAFLLLVQLALLFIPVSAPVQAGEFCPIDANGVCINQSEQVPVPYNKFFVLQRGPAGNISITGVILTLINISLLIVGLLSVLFVIIGGFRYVLAHGNEEQAEGAKKTILHAVTGLVIVILSFVIVRVISSALITGNVNV